MDDNILFFCQQPTLIHDLHSGGHSLLSAGVRHLCCMRVIVVCAQIAWKTLAVPCAVRSCVVPRAGHWSCMCDTCLDLGTQGLNLCGCLTARFYARETNRTTCIDRFHATDAQDVDHAQCTSRYGVQIHSCRTEPRTNIHHASSNNVAYYYYRTSIHDFRSMFAILEGSFRLFCDLRNDNSDVGP